MYGWFGRDSVTNIVNFVPTKHVVAIVSKRFYLKTAILYQIMSMQYARDYYIFVFTKMQYIQKVNATHSGIFIMTDVGQTINTSWWFGEMFHDCFIWLLENDFHSNTIMWSIKFVYVSHVL